MPDSCSAIGCCQMLSNPCAQRMASRRIPIPRGLCVAFSPKGKFFAIKQTAVEASRTNFPFLLIDGPSSFANKCGPSPHGRRLGGDRLACGLQSWEEGKQQLTAEGWCACVKCVTARAEEQASGNRVIPSGWSGTLQQFRSGRPPLSWFPDFRGQKATQGKAK